MNALDLVNELQHASRDYACIDWAAGVLITPAGPRIAVTSNEGAGYIPHGVFMPVGVYLLWADPVIDADFQAVFFGRANPAETLIAYAQIVGYDLAALAVSVNDGGSAAPAAAARIREYTEADTELTAADLPELEVTGRHRLAVIDPHEYMRVTTTDMAPNYGGLLTATTRALAQAEPLPPIITLGVRTDPNDDGWTELTELAASARFDAALHRPGRIGAENPAAYRAAFTLARAAELTAYWHDDPLPWPDIAYTVKQLGQP